MDDDTGGSERIGQAGCHDSPFTTQYIGPINQSVQGVMKILVKSDGSAVKLSRIAIVSGGFHLT
jgi:hypothetical protein